MTSNHELQPCPTVLLDDLATGQDAFRHRQIAEAIASMIVNEAGGRAIAITGSWGSGKSTVIRLLADALDKSGTEIKVITFDAWAHQGDPLRRTFLEHAITELDEWIGSGATWKREIDKLSRRLIETETKSSSALTPWGMYGILTGLASAPGFALFTALKGSLHSSLYVLSWIGFCLGVAPLIFGIMFFGRWASVNLCGDKKNLPALIQNSSENTEKTESNSTPEPTSIEFEQTYKRLLREALGSNKRRLVFVMDNLDRLAGEDALAIWGTLRTFFDAPLQHESWYPRVWIAVPFDEEAVSRQLGNKDNGEAGKHFLEKTFQAFYRVPPAILTNWENFLHDNFVKAFPAHQDLEEFRTIFRLYERLGNDIGVQPTPRHIKLFLNQLGSLHRQWQHAIPITTQAAFCLLLQRLKDDLLTQLRRPQNMAIFPLSLSRRLEGDWSRDMAALYFNVEPEKAYEALLFDPISNALQAGDGKALLSLEKHPGFPEVLEGIIDLNYPLGEAMDTELLAKTGRAIGALQQTRAEYEASRKHLWMAASKVERWQRFNTEMGEGVVCLTKGSAGQSLEPIVISVRKSLSFSQDLETLKDLKPWCAGIWQVLPHLISNDQVSVEKHFALDGRPDQFLEILFELNTHPDANSLIPYLKPVAPKSEIVTALAEEIAENDWDENTHLAVTQLSSLQEGWVWTDLATALTNALGAKETPVTSLKWVVETLYFLITNGKAEITTVLNACNNDHALNALHLLSEAVEHREATIVSSLLIAMPQNFALITPAQFGYRVVAQLPALVQSANSAREILTSILGEPSQAPRHDELIEISLALMPINLWRERAIENPNRKAFVGELVTGFYAEGGRLSAEEFLDNRSFWQEALEKELYNAQLQFYLDDGALSKYLLGNEYDAEYHDLYIVALTGIDNRPLKEHIASGLRMIATEDWDEALSNDTDLLSVASLVGHDLARLDQKFEAALYSHVSSILEGESDCFESHSPLSLMGLLDEDERNRFLRRVADQFAVATGSFSSGLECCDQLLINALLLVGPEAAKERLLAILEEPDSEELVWLIRLLNAWGKTSSKARQLRKALKEGIQAALADEDCSDEKRQQFKPLEQALGMKPKPSE
jgi:hypothetical protein